MARELVLIPRIKYESMLSRLGEDSEKKDERVSDRHGRDNISKDMDLTDRVASEPTIDCGNSEICDDGPEKKKLKRKLPQSDHKPKQKTSRHNIEDQFGGNSQKHKYVRQTFSEFLNKQRPSQKWIAYKI